MSTGTRVFVARLAGLPVFDPNGDQVGRVRDVVVALRIGSDAPRALGLLVEIQARRRIFVPMGRVTSIEADAVRAGHRDPEPAPLRAAAGRDAGAR